MVKSLDNQKRRDYDSDDDSYEKPTHGKVKVKITPFGPKQSTLDAAAQAVLESPLVQKYLEGTRNRLLSIEAIDAETNVKTKPIPANRYLATVFDYTHNRTILVRGRLDKQEVLKVEESGSQPLP